MKNSEYELARKVLNLANQIIINRNSHLKELNLTAAQADSLYFIQAHSGCSISDLKEYLHISHQTARGFIALCVSKSDGRYKTLSLTDAGIEIVKRMKQNGTHTGHQLLKGMTVQEQQQFSELTSRALKNISREASHEK